MKGKRPPGRNPTDSTPDHRTSDRDLKNEDAALWSIAAGRTVPLKQRKGRVHDKVTAQDATTSRVERARSKPQTDGSRSSEGATARQPARPSVPERGKRTPVPAPVTVVRTSPPISEFDRKAQRRLRSGRVQIEARIDLHGLRQDEAHAALRAFLYRSQMRGLRWVLIITGKGKAESRDPDSGFDMTDMRLRGVLRRNVPRWLDEPDLRPLIISFTEAAPHHGGAGALYVHLRKMRGSAD